MNNKIALIGNPNVGKTTLYNNLTKSFEHTGNWHGVTVDKKEKAFKYENNIYDIVDLPGLYSLTSFSFEEQVSIDYLLSNNTQIINICDANLLARNLYLTLQLLEMGKHPILLINFDREVRSRGVVYDYDTLSKMLECEVIVNDKNIKEKVAKKVISNSLSFNYSPNYYTKLPIHEISSVLTNEQINCLKTPKEFIAIKLLEKDENIKGRLYLTPEQEKKINRIVNHKDYLSLIASLRYSYIDELINKITKKKKDFVYGKFKIDKIFLNKFLAIPIFFVILFTIFYITFSSVGAYLSECLKFLIDKLIGEPVTQVLLKINAPSWIIGLFVSGIISGVGGLLSFIPQIVLLFLFLSLLEDSGYMSRLAFLFEDLFYKFGLSGKSIFTILMSFGCTTSAVLTSRNIEDKNTKIKTAMISPYMSCSAKLPIYAVIGGAFFGKGNILIIILLYILGVIVGLLISNILSKKILKSKERSFILEFPPYRVPSFKQILRIIAQNIKSFVVKVSTILLSFSVIVWIFQNFTFKFEYIPTMSSGRSMLEVIGEELAIFFRPIGLGNWGIVVSLIVGIMAKEMVVGTMSIINKVPNSTNFDAQLGLSFITSGFVISFTPLTAVIMLIFSLLYMPCISTIAVLHKEIGLKWTVITCLLQFFVAYTICFFIYQIAIGGILSKILLSILALSFIIFIFILSKKLSRKHSFCTFKCKDCNKNCH